MFSNPQLVIAPPIIAHRGASFYAPENTFAAFRKAKELGVAWVEFDVMLSADNEVVVIHDETVDRTTNGKGWVVEQTYQDLKLLDAGSWFSPIFSHEKIPTLSEVLRLLIQLKLAANIEIKAQPGYEELTVKTVLDIIQQEWQQQNLQLFVSSFSLSILRQVRKASATLPLGLLMDEWVADWQSISEKLNCISINVNQALLTAARVAEIKKAGYMVLAYTIDELARARELLGWGVAAVFSNKLMRTVNNAVPSSQAKKA